LKKNDWTSKFVILFIFLSIIIYCIHYFIFKDETYIFKIVIAQLGFLPLSTLLVTFLLNGFLSRSNKKELANRKNLDYISNEDINHLSRDISRMYKNLILVWINYMEHLNKEYPYLYSLALRINPFDKNINVEFE
jgi:hypothetical protein